MREIKFRAWGCDGDRGPQMWEPEYVMQYFDLWLADKSAVIMQYTGLKDKNGVEIYEGDIVEIPRHWDPTMPFVDVVKYIEATFMPFSDSDWGWDADECKVIGNIHEGCDKKCQ